jgi:hypothetical protein
MRSKMTLASGPGCLLRAVGAYLVFGLLSLALAVACGYWISSRQLAEAEKAWAREYEPMAALAARFPRQTDSEGAKALDALARPMGIVFIRLPSDEWDSEDPLFKALQDVGSALSDAGVKPFSPAAPSLLARETKSVSAIAAQILRGGPILWDRDINRAPGGPLPSLVAHRHMQSLLLARAHLEDLRGHQEAAAEALEASWVLNASMIERPELLCQLIASSVSGMQDGVLRSLRRPPSVWRDRTRGRPFSRNLTRSLRLEVWQYSNLANDSWGAFDLGAIESGAPPPVGVGGWLFRHATIPFVRVNLADFSEEARRAIAIVDRQTRCDLDVEGFSLQVEKSTPRWRVITRSALPPLLKSWLPMREADLRRELTGRVLEARAERAATGHWPAGETSSEVCEGLDWIYTVDRDGALVIRAAEDPFYADLPTRKLEHRLTP